MERLWSKFASAAFLASYRTVAAGAAFVPADSNTFARLLDAFLVDKAFYELGYEFQPPADLGAHPSSRSARSGTRSGE